jgi:hypothetical protein
LLRPAATASPVPTERLSPAPTPRSDPEGALSAGTYVIHPLAVASEDMDPSDDSLAVAFTVPNGWQYSSRTLTPGTVDEADVGPPGGRSIQFVTVHSLHANPCGANSLGDIEVGPTVDDLVEAIGAQTAYEASAPADVTIGGYSGKRVDMVMPREPFPSGSGIAVRCPYGLYRFWALAAREIRPSFYAMGPDNRWQANILDVEGTRLVIAVTDFPGTTPEDRAELDAIVDSIEITP